MRHFIVLLTLFMLALELSAQNKSTSLQEVITKYEHNDHVNISYDPDLIKMVNIKFDSTEVLSHFISTITKNLPFEVKNLGEDYFAIVAIESQFSLGVSDSSHSEVISPEEVVVLLNGEPIPSNVTDQRVNFAYTPRISDKVMIYAIGYDKKLVSLSQLVNNKQLFIKLQAPLLKLAEVTIEDYLTKGITLLPSKQSIKISVKDMPLLPGETDGDIFASLAALPGITTPDGRAGNIFIRGSETDQSMVLYDNIPVYHRGHYYGTISPYNPKTVDHVEVYRNGFHPRLGGRVGGAIIINSETEVRRESQSGLGVNTLFGMAYTKIPLKNKKVSISVGARHSMPSQLRSPKLITISESVFDGTGLVDEDSNLTGEVETQFEDYQSKINYQLNNKNKLSFSAMYTNTKVISQIEQIVSSSLNNDQSTFKNYGASLDWNSQFSKEWESKLTATIANYKYNFTTFNSDGIPSYLAENQLKDLNIRQEFSNDPSRELWIQMGIDYKWQEALINYKTGAPAMAFELNTTSSSHSIAPFGNIEYHGFDRWYFQMGIRATYFSLLENFNVAPRLLVNFEPTSWLTLKSSFGTYNQYLSQVKNLEFGGGGFENELWTLADGKMGNIIDGMQSMLGTILHKNTWLLDVESFHKTANNITNYEDRNLNESSSYFTMNQVTAGVDFLLKKEMTHETSVWVGYSFTQSEITLDTTKSATYKSKYVQPNVWNIGGAITKNRWKLSAIWKYASGLNANSLDIIHAELLRLRMINDQGRPTPNPFANRSERYANSHSLDLSASYQLPKSTKRNWSASFGLSIINVYDQEILVDQVFRGLNGFTDRYAQRFAPNLMVIFEW